MAITIAGSRIDLNDLLLLRFVLRAQDKFRKISAVLQFGDDYPYRPSLRALAIRVLTDHGSGSLLLRALHEL